MIDKISMSITNESGETLRFDESLTKLESRIETATADLFSQICFRNNSIQDAEIKTAEKFYFALQLQNYLKEREEDV